MPLVGRRDYGQYCGLARALELVGERWALLVIRDLMVGPRRYTDLRRGLPRIPTNILAARLKELEQSGLIRRRLLPRPMEMGQCLPPMQPVGMGPGQRLPPMPPVGMGQCLPPMQPVGMGPGRRLPPAGSIVYELTERAADLAEAVLALDRWGSRQLSEPRPGEIITAESAVMALRAAFRSEAAGGLSAGYELRSAELVIHASVHDGKAEVREGPLPGADLVIATGLPLTALLGGRVSPAGAVAGAVADGRVRLTGDPALLDRFVDVFRC
jgi:DNA-binding HxlR family transcriptional regulator